MDNRRSLVRSRVVLGWLSPLLACVLIACDAAPADDSKTTHLVCPSCRPTAGGETSDFGASVAACSLAYVKRDVGRDEAESLGFSVDAVARTIEQPIDTAMTWAALATEAGGPAHGYAAKTHVHVALSVGPYTYYELDPKVCDASTCTVDIGGTTEQTGTAGCSQRLLFVNASGELRTGDGAVAAKLSRQPVKILRLEDAADDVTVAAYANLRDVQGSLQLDPKIPEPRVGRLDLSLQYTPKGAIDWGVIDVSIYPDWDHLPDGGREVTGTLAQYEPVQGRWGTPPDSPAMTGRPGP